MPLYCLNPKCKGILPAQPTDRCAFCGEPINFGRYSALKIDADNFSHITTKIAGLDRLSQTLDSLGISYERNGVIYGENQTGAVVDVAIELREGYRFGFRQNPRKDDENLVLVVDLFYLRNHDLTGFLEQVKNQYCKIYGDGG